MSSGGDTDGSLDEEAESAEDVNYARVLQFLLRSGRLQLVQQMVGGSEMVQPDDEQGAAAAADFSSLRDSDLERKLLLDCGLREVLTLQQQQQQITRPCHLGLSCNVIRLLQKRAAGHYLHFRQAQQRHLVSHYLPNRKATCVAAYNQKLFCGRFSRDGNRFLSACQDQFIRLFDTTQGKFKLDCAIQAHDVGWSVLDLVLSPNAHQLVYSTWSPCLQLYSLATKAHYELALNPPRDRFCVFSLAFSCDGAEVLAGANYGDLYCYNIELNRRVMLLRSAHEDDLNAVAFADDTGQIFFSAGDDGLIKVWDRRTLTPADSEHVHPVGVFAGHHDGITFIDSKGDSRHLITNSKDQSIKLWDLRRFSSSCTIDAARQKVAQQDWDYRWQVVPRALRGAGPPRLPGDSSLMTYRGHVVRHTLMRARFSPAGTSSQSVIYAGCATGQVLLWDVLTGRVLRRIDAHRVCVRDVSWHPWEVQRLLTTSWDGTHMELDYRAELEDDVEDASKLALGMPHLSWASRRRTLNLDVFEDEHSDDESGEM